jgi:hypothetical protein
MLYDGGMKIEEVNTGIAGSLSPKPLVVNETVSASAPVVAVAARLPDEYDRRGVKLPARTRVGGIIIPQ